MITQTLKLNLIPGQVLPRVNVSQYDAGTRTLQMLLYNGDQAFNIPVGYGGFVQGTKPDRTGFQYAATVTEGSNVVTLVITQQMTAVSGEVTCELVIANGDDRIATVNFILYVEPAALADDTVISDTELPLIEEAAELAQRIDGIAADVEADADRAEAAADNAETWVSNYPRIGQNGNWFVFDTTTETFVDTGVSATGPQGPQGDDGPTGPQGPTGPTGNGIVSITKTGTSGLVDTYTILFTDGSTTTFTVTNGQDGQGSGDMTKAVYDSTNAVADAGGIVAYVASQAGAGSLSGLSDVSLSTLANGESLVYNSTSQKWENGSVSYSSLSGKPTLGTAASKDSTNAVMSGSTDLIESGAVASEIQILTDQVDDISDEIADMNNVLGAKNLLPNVRSGSNTISGLTFTVNSDGSITVNGTATDNVSFGINSVNSPSQYIKPPYYSGNILSGSIGGSADTYYMYLVYSEDGSTYGGTTLCYDGDVIIPDKAGYKNVAIHVKNGTVMNNVVFKPMIRPASIQDDTYVPYSMTNREMTPYVQAISNPNLLDNPWFTVNQRGITNDWSTGFTYGVDRWLKNGYGTITVNNGLTTDTQNTEIYQRFEPGVYNQWVGKTMTLSILDSNNNLLKATGVVLSSGNSFEASNSDFSISLSKDSYAAYVMVKFITTSKTLKAVKLELGSASTLAMDTAPNYATELLKCQRYFISFGDSSAAEALGFGQGTSTDAASIYIPIPVKMRAKPSIATLTGTIYLRNEITPLLITNAYVDVGGVACVMITAGATGAIPGKPYEAFLEAGAKLELSADL